MRLRLYFSGPILSGLVLAAFPACSGDTGNQFEAHFERPVDIAFACIDRTRARPLSACDGVQDEGEMNADADAGVSGTGFIGMAVQETSGDVVISRLDSATLVDSDPLTPGFNGIAVGSRPIAADTTTDGCFVMVANAGSCDLAAIDVYKASAPLIVTGGLAGFERDSVRRQPVLNSASKQLAASPERMVLGPPTDPDTCNETPVGTAYLSYPRCGKVVAVDLATKTVISSIDFSGETPVIAGGDVVCPAECGDIEDPAIPVEPPPVPVPARAPGALVFEPEGGRVYIGARNASALTIADVGPDGAFTAVQDVPLENAGGLLRLAASGQLTMGVNGQLGLHRFVYAIATDASIRVVDVTPTRPATECDTQIDPRVARSITDVSRLACFPVEPPPANPLAPPANQNRRKSARGPGIRLPGNAMPFDVAITERMQVESPVPANPSPAFLNGAFAFITGRNAGQGGVAFIVTIDDDSYPDFEVSSLPSEVDVGRSMPHQLRDGTESRRHPTREDCGSDSVLNDRFQGPIRMSEDPRVSSGLYNVNLLLPFEAYTAGEEIPIPVTPDPDPTDTDVPVSARLLPLLHQVACDPNNPAMPDVPQKESVTIWANSGQNTAAELERAFPDLQRSRNELWRVQWEGSFSIDRNEAVRAGGEFSPVPGDLALHLDDSSAPFCSLGVEEGDNVRITGCAQDFQCAVDETCYFHPEAPPSLLGICLPTDRIDELANLCRPLLVSNRQYLVKRDAAMFPDQLTLVPRPTVLASSPPDGCVSDEQCSELFRDEVRRGTREADSPEAPRTYKCGKNEFLTGQPRCIALCPGNRDLECPSGSVCQDKVCVEGGFPAGECLANLQQYEVRATEQFTVVGSQTGYLHNRLLDVDEGSETSGQCITDPNPDIYRVGRFSPIEPECEAGDPYLATVNPCSILLDEPVFYQNENDETNRVLGTRKSRGIRFANWVMRVEFADVVVPATPTDESLTGILQAAYPPNFLFTFEIGGAFSSLVQTLSDGLTYTFTVFPSRIKRAPNESLWVVEQGDVDSARHGALLGIGNNTVLVLQ